MAAVISSTVASRSRRGVSQLGLRAARYARAPVAAVPTVAAVARHCMHTTRISIALVALAAAAASGCGDDERTFTAPEFVAEANRNGAALELGAALAVTESDDEVYGIAIDERGEDEHAREDSAESGEHGGGSLRITEDSGAAEDEHARCESAASLICYRAANVVLILEPGVPAADLARVEAAIRGMESS